MTPHALVIGGSGYVGRELCRQLKNSGQRVTSLNRRSSPDLPGIDSLQADISDAVAFRSALNGRKFDVIHHLASLPGDTGHPEEMIRVNIVGLTNVLNYAREAKLRRFVLSSSISAYEWYPATKFSAPDYAPVDEEHPCRPRDMYSTTKRMQELLALTFFHQFQLPVVVLRLTAVVGPRGRGGGRGWREFAEQLHAGQRVQIPHFSLEEVCHYVDFRDVARMHTAAAESPGAVGQTFNCCGPAPTSGAQFAAILKRHFPGINIETGFPWSMAQGNKIEFSMAKARRLLEFEPAHSLEDSVLAIKEWIAAGGLEADRVASEKFGGGVPASVTPV